MGLLKFFSKPTEDTLVQLPTGSFTIDRTGRLVVGTVPSSFPANALQEVGRSVLETFREAQAAQLPLSELIVNYGSFKIVAREMRGGAMIFLTPINTTTT